MKSTGNTVDAVLRLREAEQAQRPRSWAVLRWVPRVAYYATQQDARNVLADTPVGRRAGLVDCDTGDTWVNRKNYAAVMAAVRRAKLAPEHFRRVGALGPIKPKRRPYRTRR